MRRLQLLFLPPSVTYRLTSSCLSVQDSWANRSPPHGVNDRDVDTLPLQARSVQSVSHSPSNRHAPLNRLQDGSKLYGSRLHSCDFLQHQICWRPWQLWEHKKLTPQGCIHRIRQFRHEQIIHPSSRPLHFPLPFSLLPRLQLARPPGPGICPRAASSPAAWRRP